MKITLTEEQWKIFSWLLKSESAKTVEEIVQATGFDHPIVNGSVTYGQNQGWLTIDEQVREELMPAGNAMELIKEGLPERQILPILAKKERIPMRDLAEIAKEKNIAVNEIIRWGGQRDWIIKEKGEILLTDTGREALDKTDDDEQAITKAAGQERLFLDELPADNIDPEKVKSLLGKRPNIAKIKPRTVRLVGLTQNGRQNLSGDVSVMQEKNRMTSEDITSGEWKNIRLRQYDVTLEAEKIYPAKIHLMQKIIQETRTAFLEMGFSEIISPQVESAFWDFDALFQPQDHPARDAQDTFYMEQPKIAKLPAGNFVENVRQTHENGWETGSSGWGYQWDIERSKQVVLRTHTTATTIRAIAEDPNPPRKVFCVGKVFRNEAITYKHLPEFFQVDGIVIDEEASLATLLGTLSEFYRKMGFKKVKFKPGFFPYTEPSAEAFVYMESKKSWIEMGGSGVFRPEVTRPFGCKTPVLAWGLGLERLAMMRYGLSDIRELFFSDFDKLKEVSLCQ